MMIDGDRALSNGKEVGRFLEYDDGVWLVKARLSRTRHMLRIPEGWAIATAHLEELERRGGRGVRLFLTDGAILQATIEDFQQYGFDLKRGYEPQTALTLNRWKVLPQSTT